MELDCADRVRCATYLLKDDALLWWEGAVVGLNLATLLWEDFKEVFYVKYFTEDVRSRLTREFMTLRQDSCTVAEFIRKFEQGCHFVPMIVDNPKEKLRVLRAEQDQKDIEADRQNKRSCPAAYQQLPQQQNKKEATGLRKGQEEWSQKQVDPKPHEPPICLSCQRPHSRVCLRGSGKCYKCGATGHMKKDCPQTRSLIKGSVFLMQAEEVDPDISGKS
ncbi:uncharacterized protein LOC122029144 [Zingiber officinale]|uniref:uncharacterized protein LOC122029144 n=1 Tax=Zingiber officinale TaxID=94328 RepID=UPI001C4DD425|nr:uncharacterized protein LOC122029144 [Zingiber officinale]